MPRFYGLEAPELKTDPTSSGQSTWRRPRPEPDRQMVCLLVVRRVRSMIGSTITSSPRSTPPWSGRRASTLGTSSVAALIPCLITASVSGLPGECNLIRSAFIFIYNASLGCLMLVHPAQTGFRADLHMSSDCVFSGVTDVPCQTKLLTRGTERCAESFPALEILEAGTLAHGSHMDSD